MTTPTAGSGVDVPLGEGPVCVTVTVGWPFVDPGCPWFWKSTDFDPPQPAVRSTTPVASATTPTPILARIVFSPGLRDPPRPPIGRLFER